MNEVNSSVGKCIFFGLLFNVMMSCFEVNSPITGIKFATFKSGVCQGLNYFVFRDIVHKNNDECCYAIRWCSDGMAKG